MCSDECVHSHSAVHTSRYVWEKSSSVIDVNTSPRLRLDLDGTLHISQTWSGDIGTYTCRVTSVGGNDSRSAHLRVRFVYLYRVSSVLSCCLVFLLLFISEQDMMDGCFLHCCGLSLLSSPIPHPLSNIYNASLSVWLFNSVICCLSCLILFIFITRSLFPPYTHAVLQATAPCSRKPNSGIEHLREEGHQPHMGPGLWWK